MTQIAPLLRQASFQILSRTLPRYHRFLFAMLNPNEKMLGLQGARGAGKTTLLLQLAHQKGLPLEQILYLSCDHPAMIETSLYEIAQIFYQEGGQLLIFDEIHRISGFAQDLKAIRDTFNLQVWFSGSSAIQLGLGSADLSRRALIYQVPALSLREFIEIETGETFEPIALKKMLENPIQSALQVTQRIRPLAYFKSYQEYGAYPYYLESKETYAQKLLSVINYTIEADLPILFNLDPKKTDKLKKMLYMLCTTPPLEINKNKLSGALDTAWITVKKYLDVMEMADLVIQIRGGSGMRTMNKPDKLLLSHANLFHCLCATPDTGSLRETFVVSHLKYTHQVRYHDQGDFKIDDTWVFEVGGPSKTASQIKNQPNAFLIKDGIEIGEAQEIPLWLIGFIY